VATDFYAVLGIERGASETEIKRAYRSLARKHHPDVSKDKAQAEARFKEINEAYEVLSDPQKRQMYDRYGSAGGAGAAGASGFDVGGFGGEGFGSIFDMFFGAGGAAGQTQGRPAGPARGADLRYDLQVTLEEAFRGAEREISFNHLTQCETCRGSGAKPGTLIVSCDRCSGSGVMRTIRQTPLGQFVTQTTCTRCGGDGQSIPTPCESCRGRGRIERPRTLSVKIPTGVEDGSRIRLTGNGEAGARGGPAGDLYVYISIAAHPRFRRDGIDLTIDVPITFPQAALGAVIEVQAIDGKAELQVPAGTQSASTFRLRGRGMPTIRGNAHGDLLVTVHVAVPVKVTRQERELLEMYAKTSGDAIEDRPFFDRFKDAFRVD
jgi:molecular chaperone DnaJ